MGKHEAMTVHPMLLRKRNGPDKSESSPMPFTPPGTSRNALGTSNQVRPCLAASLGRNGRSSIALSSGQRRQQGTLVHQFFVGSYPTLRNSQKT